MKILVCGLAWSGSSAVIDMLREYDQVGVLPGEFDEFRRSGMIADHLEGRISYSYPSRLNESKYLNDPNIKSSIKKLFIKFGYNGNSLFDYNTFQRKELYKKLIFKIQNDSNSTEYKLNAVRHWVGDLKEIYASNKQFFAIDQPIQHRQHFEIWPKVLEPFKMIVVYRDPRDQMAEIIRQGHLFYHMRSPVVAIYGGDRIGAINFLKDAIEAKLYWFKKIQEKHGSSKVVMISFEKFIKDHENIRGKFKDWIGLSEDFERNSVLKINESIKNIGIYKNILNDEEVEILDGLMNWYNTKEEQNKFY